MQSSINRIPSSLQKLFGPKQYEYVFYRLDHKRIQNKKYTLRDHRKGIIKES